MTLDPFDTLIPEGEYRVGYVGYTTGKPYGRTVYFAVFKITELGNLNGLPILRFYNAYDTPRIARSSNLFLDYSVITGGRPPRGVTPGLFLDGCEVLAEVVTVKASGGGQPRAEVAEGLRYSKIRRVLRVVAGTPRCARLAPRKRNGAEESRTSTSNRPTS